MKKWKDIIQKEKHGQESRPFRTVQNSFPSISSINNLNQHKVAKSMPTFDFSMLYTKIPRDKLLYILNEITDFAFKGRTRNYVSVYSLQSKK